MFGNPIIAESIAKLCYQADKECREELRTGTIVSERDYVSTLMTKIRAEISMKLSYKCHAQTVNPTIEKQYGVDGMIIFQYGNEIKAGLFEAKKPNVLIPNYSWDYLKSGQSHFSKQIKKQRIWNEKFVLWEMFFNEADNGFQCPTFDIAGSSCVWHDEAHKFMNKEKLIYNKWTTVKLKEMLNESGINFQKVIYETIICNVGHKIKIDTVNNKCVVSNNNNNNTLNIPLPTTINQENNEHINKFLLENKIDSYIHIDLTQK